MRLLMDVDKRLATPETRHYVEELMADIERGKRSDDVLKESLSIYRDLYRAVAKKLVHLLKGEATY
jgi:hypothetical protein